MDESLLTDGIGAYQYVFFGRIKQRLAARKSGQEFSARTTHAITPCSRSLAIFSGGQPNRSRKTASLS
jgi:predicted lipoprotein